MKIELRGTDMDDLLNTMGSAGWKVFLRLLREHKQRLLEGFAEERSQRKEDNSRGEINLIKSLTKISGDLRKKA